MLRDLLRRIPKREGTWYFKARLEQINVAVESGIPKMSEFDALDEMDKAYLIARHRVRDQMQSYERYMQERELRQSTAQK